MLRRAVGARAALKAQVVGLREPPEEPGRTHSHWDFVLLEMAWMSNDFAQERQWKMAQARRAARSAARKAREGGLGAAPEKKAKGGGGRKTRASARGGEDKEEDKDAGGGNGAEPESPGTPEPSDGPAAACYFECDEGAATSLLREAEAQEALRLSASHRRAVDFEAQLVACRKAVALAARVAEAEQERTLLLRAREERLAVAQAAADAAAAEEARLLGLKAVKRKKGRKDEVETADEFAKRLKMDGEGILGEDLPLNLGDDLIKPKKKKKKKADLLAGTSLDRAKLDSLALGLDGLPLPRPKKSKKKKVDPLALGPDGKPLKGGKKKGEGAGWKKGKGKKAAMGIPSTSAEIPWTVLEDQLLCALVHEFTANWKLVSDVLSSCLALRGLYRRPDQCKYRFRLVTRAASSGDAPQEELVIGGMKLNKASARLLLQNCTPIDEDTLKGHLDALCHVGAKYRSKPDKLEDKAYKEVHQSHALTQNMAHGHRQPLGPLELCEIALQMGTAPVGVGPAQMGVPQPGMPPGQSFPGMPPDPSMPVEQSQMGMHGAARVGPSGAHQGYPGMIPGGGHNAMPMHGAGVGAAPMHGGHPRGMPGGGAGRGSIGAAALALQTGKHPVSGQPLTEAQRQQIYAHLQAQRAGGARMGALPGHGMPGVPQPGLGHMGGMSGSGLPVPKGVGGPAKSHKKGGGKTAVAKGGVQKVSHKKGQGKAAMARLAAAKAKAKK